MVRCIDWPSQRRALGGNSLPFLVASVLEGLRASEFKDLTRMVPGEADWWCAEWSWHAANGAAAVIFTNDSDLLASELRPSSLVVMFRDILEVRTDFRPYCPGDIAKALGLGADLQSLAYSVSTGHGTRTLKGHVKSAIEADATHGKKYNDYLKTIFKRSMIEGVEQEFAKIESKVKGDVLQKLDPRVSELFLRLLGFVPNQGDAQAALEIYLPVLVEDMSYANAWRCDVATHIRTLAYSLVNTVDAKQVREFVRKGAQVGVNEVHLFDSEFQIEFCKKITKDLKTWLKTHTSLTPTQKWRLYASKAALLHLNQLPSSYFPQILRAVQGRIHPGGPHTQFRALVDTILYSLRILFQSTHIYRNLDPDIVHVDDVLLSAVRDLSEILQTMPKIADLFPSCDLDPESLPRDQKLVAAIKRLKGMIGEQESDDEGTGKQDGKVSNRKRKRKKGVSSEAVRAADKSNPYALLDLLDGGQGSDDEE